jgi:segregation and condensation protein A
MTDPSALDPTGPDTATPAAAAAPDPVDDGLAVVRAGSDDYSIEARGTFTSRDAHGYLPTPESELLRVRVEETFEGPLDLLLFLIEKHAVDILDIPIRLIVSEYLKVLDGMQSLNLDVVGEFLVMASTLAHIKSKMLLPQEERPLELPFPEIDPRAELVRRLLEYQRFKDAAARLDALPQLGRDVYARPLIAALYDEAVPEQVDTLQLNDVNPFDLIRLFDALLKRQRKTVVHEVLVERISVGARINELVDIFVGDRSCLAFTFAELVDRFGPRTRRSVIVSFLSVLEMARLRLVRLQQDADTNAITIAPVHDNLRDDDDDAALNTRLADVDEFSSEGTR